MGRLIAEVDFEIHVAKGNAVGTILLVLGSLGLNQEASLLATDGTFGEPSVARHFDDQFALDIADGLFSQQEALKQSVIFVLVFAGENLKVATGKTMFGGVLSYFFLAFLGASAGAFLPIGAIGCEFTSGSGHIESPLEAV